MRYAVDLTLHIGRKDIPTGRLSERHETREAADEAGRAIVARFAARGIEATYEVQDVTGESSD